MSSEADNDKRQISKSRWVQSKWVLVAMVIIYIMVLATTLSIHKKHKRYFLQHNFSTGIDVHATQKGAVGENNDGKVNNDAASALSVDLTDGQHVTDILQNKLQNEQTVRMRFLPGTLQLTQAETLSHCYADPKIYKHHFTKRKQRGIPISLKHKLVFAMIAKSGSSTGRWVMNNVLEAEELRVNKDLHELSLGGKYEDFDVIAFVRDPLSRFYSSYDETYFRYGPWMTEVHKDKGGYASWAKHVKEFEHPHAYLYENMTVYKDFQDAFCPPHIIPPGNRALRVTSPRQHNWCNDQPTHENGTLAARFERFVWDYDGISSWDVHLSLQVPLLSNQDTGRSARIDEVFSTEASVEHWEHIVSRYDKTLPMSDSLFARSVPRRFNPKLVSIETKRRICQLAAIDYCCLNMMLPAECKNVDISCALDKDENGDYRIQPWTHPNEVAKERLGAATSL